MSEERESRPFMYLPLLLLLLPPALLLAPLDSMLLPMPCPPLLVPAPLLLLLAPAVYADLIDELAPELLPEAPEAEPMPSGEGRAE